MEQSQKCLGEMMIMIAAGGEEQVCLCMRRREHMKARGRTQLNANFMTVM